MKKIFKYMSIYSNNRTKRLLYYRVIKNFNTKYFFFNMRHYVIKIHCIKGDVMFLFLSYAAFCEEITE